MDREALAGCTAAHLPQLAEKEVEEEHDECNNGTLQCPHKDCDGPDVFVDKEEARQHERDWHSGPYVCGDCSTRFAAGTALRRHRVGSGHGHHGGSVAGRAAAGDLTKVIESSSNNSTSNSSRRRRRRRDGKGIYDSSDNGSTDPFANIDTDTESLGSMLSWPTFRATENDEALQPPSMRTSRDLTCTVSCCRFFKRVFTSEQMHQKYVDSHGHQLGQTLHDTLPRSAGCSSEQRIAQMERARRDLQCDLGSCAWYGHRFSSSWAYSTHLQTTAHSTTCPASSADAGYKRASKSKSNHNKAEPRHLDTRSPSSGLQKRAARRCRNYVKTPEHGSLISPSPSTGPSQRCGSGLNVCRLDLEARIGRVMAEADYTRYEVDERFAQLLDLIRDLQQRV